jgi:histidinol phosphatase-like PHP family hydrolase
LKIDLHTHCREATSCSTPTPDIVRRIVSAVKARGLDGIAVTEHYTHDYAYQVKEIVHQYFNDEILIIPGKEMDHVFLGIEKGLFHLVELYLPGGATFRFIAHPGHPHIRDLSSHIDGNIHGLELRNPSHDDEMDGQMIRELARKHDLLLLTNSDAHSLSDIGHYYNDIDIEDLSSRAKRPHSKHASH